MSQAKLGSLLFIIDLIICLKFFAINRISRFAMFCDRAWRLHRQLFKRGDLSRSCGAINSASAFALSPLSTPTCPTRQYSDYWLVSD
jgi:hypothetical protein